MYAPLLELANVAEPHAELSAPTGKLRLKAK